MTELEDFAAYVGCVFGYTVRNTKQFYESSKLRLTTVRHVTSIGLSSITPVSTLLLLVLLVI